MRIKILDEAREDLVPGFHFYESREPGLGSYFLDCLFSDIDSLLVYAGIHQVAYASYRCIANYYPVLRRLKSIDISDQRCSNDVMFETKKRRDSPLKKPPLRQAGQFLDEEMARLLEKIMEYVVVGTVMVVLALVEWYRWYFSPPPSPWIFTTSALLVCAYCLMKIALLRTQRQAVHQGRDGERVVGQQLESLRAKGFKVLHDVPGDQWNIDHVLIGPKGIFCVETKTISKRKGKAEITYNGQHVCIDGFVPDRDPIRQIKAASNWLRDFLKERTGKDYPVRSVLLYPGWYVSKQPGGAEVWVLNEKAFPAFLEVEYLQLMNEEIELAHACLCDYVRLSNAA